MTLVPCACGCGTLIEDKDKKGVPRRFVKGHSNKGFRIPINKDDLSKLYLEEGLSIQQTAEKMGISSRTVANRFKEFGIKSRTISDALTTFKIDKKELYRLYWKENLSTYKIGDMYGVSNFVVLNRMDRFGIKRRFKSDGNIIDIGIEDSDLYDLYVNKEMTLSEIATKCDVCISTIERRINDIGIDVDRSSNRGGRSSRYIDIDISKDDLHNLYCVENLSATQIADTCGVSRKTISNRLDEFGIARNQRRHKTQPEMVFEDICTKHSLPFHYVGDGSLWIGDNRKLNPDFIEANGKKIIVEIFGDYWHNPSLNPKIQEAATLEYRKRHYNRYGWESFFIWEHELKMSDADQFVLNMLEAFK